MSQSCAQSGHRVTMMDVNEDSMEKAMESITWSLRKLTEKGKLKEPYEDIVSRIDRSQVHGTWRRRGTRHRGNI